MCKSPCIPLLLFLSFSSAVALPLQIFWAPIKTIRHASLSDRRSKHWNAFVDFLSVFRTAEPAHWMQISSAPTSIFCDSTMVLLGIDWSSSSAFKLGTLLTRFIATLIDPILFDNFNLTMSCVLHPFSMISSSKEAAPSGVSLSPLTDMETLPSSVLLSWFPGKLAIQTVSCHSAELPPDRFVE